MKVSNCQQLYRIISKSHLVFRNNTYRLLLDVEQFNYADYNKVPGGLNIALHHHSDKPMIQFSSQLISTGLETHINEKPILSYTTKNAISMLTPKERKCYTNTEANLNYLPFSSGYRYDMNNCLLDDAIGNIVWHCDCFPSFTSAMFSNPLPSEIRKMKCIRDKMDCAIAKMKIIHVDNVTTSYRVSHKD